MQETFEPLNSLDELKKYLETNLLTKAQAAEITGQTTQAFNQSVALGRITPFYQSEGSTSSKVRLYLKSDIETYRKNKKS